MLFQKIAKRKKKAEQNALEMTRPIMSSLAVECRRKGLSGQSQFAGLVFKKKSRPCYACRVYIITSSYFFQRDDLTQTFFAVLPL